MTRVLFINHPEADFGEYFLYHGLCQLLGPENVIDYPFKPSYHGQVHEYPSFHSAWTPAADPTLNAKFERGIGVTAPYDFTIAQPGRAWTEEEVADRLNAGWFDVTVLGSGRQQVVETLRRFDSLGLPLPRLVQHDGEDHAALIPLTAKAKVLLKRELLPGASLPGVRLVPFPFSTCIPSPPEPLPPRSDVLYSVGLTHAVRAEAFTAIDEMPGVVVDRERRDWHGYIRALREARIAVCPRGFGWDTVRRWEAPSCAFSLIQRLDIVDEHPLVDGEHCAFWTNADEIPGLIRRYLSDDATRERIRTQGQAWLYEHHTNAARAQRMLQVVEEVYG